MIFCLLTCLLIQWLIIAQIMPHVSFLLLFNVPVILYLLLSAKVWKKIFREFQSNRTFFLKSTSVKALKAKLCKLITFLKNYKQFSSMNLV